MTHQNFDHMFSPFNVRGMCVKNRVVMMPMGSNMAMPDGSLSERHLNYYRLRAKGGVSLILVENVAVTYPMGANGTTQLRLDQDCYIPRLYDLCETVHAYGSCIGVQLNHAGAAAQSKRIGAQPVSAWNLPLRAGGEIPRPLTVRKSMPSWRTTPHLLFGRRWLGLTAWKFMPAILIYRFNFSLHL